MKRHLPMMILVVWVLLTGAPSPFLFSYGLEPPTAASSIGTMEDPQARVHYELSMLADPKTGQVPDRIREKELQFSARLPRRLEANYRLANERIYDPAGPFNVGGRTRAVAFDSRDENTLLAGGVSGSMWKSTNGGSIWVRTSDPQNRHSVTALAQDTRPGKEDIWYHGTGELLGNSARALGAPYRGVGIYKSTDGGNSWDLLPATSGSSPDGFNNQFQYIWSLETNPANLGQDEVLAAAYGGILRSVDGGASWSVVLGDRLFDLPDTTDLNCATSSFYTTLRRAGDWFFSALSSASSASAGSGCEDNSLSPHAGFYFSGNGENWQSITPPGFPDYHERTVIGFSANRNQIYFLTEGENTTLLWRLDVNGLAGTQLQGNWTDLSANVPALGGTYGAFNAQGGYNMLVDVHPDDPQTVYIGGTNLYRSTSGFTNRSATKWIGGYHPNNSGATYPGHHPDQHAILFYPSDANRMITANDGGLRRTTNNLADSVTWASLNNGYLTAQFYTINQQHDEGSDLITGGMQDNGSYIRDAVGTNPAWVRLLGGDGAYSAISRNKDFVYVSFQNSQIYRLTLNSSNQLSSFARVDPLGGGEAEGQTYLFVNPYQLDPLNSNRMFLVGGNELWRNDNLLQIPGGSQKKTAEGWSRIPGTRLSAGVFTAVEKSPVDDVLYAGTLAQNPSVFRIDNASSFGREQVTQYAPAVFPPFGHIACVAVNPQNSDELVVVFSNYRVPSIFRSVDGGSTFEDIGGNLEENPDGSGNGPSVRWAEIVPTTDGFSYFVGTSTGLYSTKTLSGQATVWIKESPEEVGSAVVPMMDYRTIDGRLVVATHGHGTYRMFLPEALRYAPEQETAELALLQNFPNPFRDQTRIEFRLPENETVQIDLYNQTGQLVKNLLWGPQYAGRSSLTWDGTNTSGVPVKAGVYHCVLRFRDQQLSQRIIYQP